jgi:hypothetical protein
MNWKLKFCFILILSVPSFTGYPVNLVDSEVLSGITYGWILYFFVVNSSILILNGPRFFENIVAVAALISLPVVFLGATVSYLIYLVGLGYNAGPTAYSAHYVSLCITMLTVIPLALAIIAIVPFHDFEHHLLKNSQGVSKLQKFLLMFLRVFNHIVYFVIPNILEAVREERQYVRWASKNLTRDSSVSTLGKVNSIQQKLKGLIRVMIQLAVEGICAAIQYIPLWAAEITQLPGRKKSLKRSKPSSY